MVVLGKGPDSAAMTALANREVPRADYLEIARLLEASVGSFTLARAVRGSFFNGIFQRKPILGSVMSAFLDRNKFDRMFTTGEDIGLPLALLLRAARWRGALTVTVHKCLSPRRQGLFRLAGPRAFRKLICVSQAQRRILVDELKFPPEMVVSLLNSVDEKFFTPLPDSGAEPYVFACGLENRDYTTLSAAAALTSFKFRIVRSGWNSLSGFLKDSPEQLPNVICEGRLSYPDLRQAYADARIVVVPLNDVPYAAGVTGLVEAMAMGKAIVATASRGIAEYLHPDISVVTVPPGDPAALAAAIRTLWDDPARCAAMGAYNRALIERTMTVDHYCQQVASIVRQPDTFNGETR